MMGEEDFQNSGRDWQTRLTTADGSSIELDPSLLEPGGESTRRSRIEDEIDEIYDPLDDLGKTPPRTSIMRNRKWTSDKKHGKEMEKRGGAGPAAPGNRQQLRTKSLQFALKGHNSPKASKARRNQVELKAQTNFRDYIQDEQNHQFEFSIEDTDGSKTRNSEDERADEELGRSRANTMSLGSGGNDNLSAVNPLRQADSLPMGYRVSTTARFMALNSFPVPPPTIDHPHSLTSSGTHTPRKRSSVCESQDRIAFHRVLSAIFKSQTKKEKQRYELIEGYDRQPSKEETLYQNEVKELIWLDLQSWFAGRSLESQDQWLINERKKAEDVSVQVSTYRFSKNSSDMDQQDESNEESKVVYDHQESTDSVLSTADVFYDAQETITSKSKLSPVILDPSLESALFKLGLDPEPGGKERQPRSGNGSGSGAGAGLVDPQEGGGRKEQDNPSTFQEEDHTDGITMSFPNISLNHHQEDFCDSLVVICPHRIKNTNNALLEVEDILQKVENIESLFPSSNQLVRAYPAYGDTTFKDRVRVLCMWFNLTDQLNKKIELIGTILRGFGGRHKHLIPWPQLEPGSSSMDEGLGTFNSDITSTKMEEKCLGSNEISRNSSSTNLQTSSPHKVQFRLTADVMSSSPSDSNNSSSSGGGGVHSDPAQPGVPVASSGDGLGVKRPYPVRQESAASQLSGSFLNDSDFGENELSSNPYRHYVEKMLKTKGIRKTLTSLHKITRVTLRRAKIALSRPKDAGQGVQVAPNVYHPHLEERFSSCQGDQLKEDELELSKYGCWSKEFSLMNLPSFRATYLFLSRIPRDIIHECLIIRLEQKPVEPSELSIRQLMRECKEALKLAVNERQRYILRVKAAIIDVEKDKEFLECFDREMEEYDDHLTETLDVYLEYLRNFVTMIQGDVSLLLSTYQKNLLEQEWDFVKATCPHIPGGESRAGNTFCQMARGMLSAIEDFLQTGNDEIMKNMYVLADSFTEEEENMELDYHFRKRLLEAFRGFQSLFVEARDRSIKAIAFAKLLRKDLEVAAEYKLTADPRKLLNMLHMTGHVQVKAPHSKQHLIFIPGTIKNKEEHILQLLDMHCGQAGIHDTNQGYLVLTEHKPGDRDKPLLWEGETIFVKPTAETTISLSQIEVHGVLLVAPTAVELEGRRKEFTRCMRDVLVGVQNQRATSQAIAASLEDVKQGALSLRQKISQELASVEEKCDTSSLEALEPADRDTLVRRMREILQQCYKFGFEYHRELDRLITGEEGRKDLARGNIQFSQQWMRFVLNWCDRGRGLRPDWAFKGIEFSIHAANPHNTKYLDDCEFQEFQTLINECHNHVALDPDRKSSRPYSRSGSRTSSRTGSPHRTTSADSRADLDRSMMPPPTAPLSPGSPTHHGGNASPLSTLPGGGAPTSPYNTLGRRKRSEGGRRSIPAEDLDATDISVRVPAFANLPWRERVARSIESFEQERDENRQHQQTIGRVLDKTLPEDRIHIKARLVKFSWQRGVKIGQGHFGKVYTAINNETGDIMAMKEIPLQPNDHKTLKNVADELRIFESIHHPNLINYFGVEIHREEMLIFMEYCPEGTLEALVTSTESGLEESMVRRYTRQILQAIACLHEHGIVHRDIKGANIFLTDEMRNLKLGDFGCAVKIKAHTTMPGELQGFVGTQAYMAPEVFTRNMAEGHGRAADIWSLSCVVIEMATGLRPWAQLESNYQIMFKVGMGETPEIPDSLSEEGKEFLQLCFVHDPSERASAEDLLNHQFTKIYEDEEGTPSLPLFSSVNLSTTLTKKPTLTRKDSSKYT